MEYLQEGKNWKGFACLRVAIRKYSERRRILEKAPCWILREIRLARVNK